MHIKMNNGNLSVTFADNEKFFPKHKNGYNGIAALEWKDHNNNDLKKGNILVPHYAGLNLEHYFDQ